MKIKAIVLSLALMLTLVSGYVIYPESDPFAIDVLAGASTVSNATQFETQCGPNAVGTVKYICISTNVTVTKNISVEKPTNSTSTRVMALTTSESGSPSYILTIPLLTVNYKTTFEYGRIVGNIFINTTGCSMVNFNVTGNIYFATLAIKNAFTISGGSVSGTQTIGNPLATPSPIPTATPTVAPTSVPTATPTIAPTGAPTNAPTATPTAGPTNAPTAAPTIAPSGAPTAAPTVAPTVAPTAVPTATPVHVTGVSLNKTSASLKVKGTLQLTASVLPSTAADKSVLWRTANLKIATIDSTGKVTAKGPGITTVTATTNDGSFVAKCKLTVTQPVTGVKLNKTNATILKGKTLVLKATVLPANASNKKVVWKSSNVKIATVSSIGKITAKAKGIAYVSVTTVDGKKLAKCKVTVK